MSSQTATFFDLARPYLDDVEQRMRTAPGDHHHGLNQALEQLLLSGGKRIRPITAVLTGEMLGADREHIVTHAAAIEMLHTATLVHDDLIDDAFMRRGFPTINARLSPAATVLTGDYIFARAAHLASQTGSLELMEAFARTLMTIVSGEITQLLGGPEIDSLQAYYERIYAKTGSLFEVATEGAALISGADETVIAHMKAFGYNIGLAFQIVDDLLDFTADEASLGKPVGSDLRQGLITLPTLLFVKENDPQQDLLPRLHHREVEESELEALIEVIRNSDSIEKARRQAEAFIEKGEAHLEDMPQGPARAALYELARYVVSRTI